MSRIDKKVKQRKFLNRLLDRQLKRTNEEVRQSRQSNLDDYIKSLKSKKPSRPKSWRHIPTKRGLL